MCEKTEEYALELCVCFWWGGNPALQERLRQHHQMLLFNALETQSVARNVSRVGCILGLLFENCGSPEKSRTLTLTLTQYHGPAKVVKFQGGWTFLSQRLPFTPVSDPGLAANNSERLCQIKKP